MRDGTRRNNKKRRDPSRGARWARRRIHGIGSRAAGLAIGVAVAISGLLLVAGTSKAAVRPVVVAIEPTPASASHRVASTSAGTPEGPKRSRVLAVSASDLDSDLANRSQLQDSLSFFGRPDRDPPADRAVENDIQEPLDEGRALRKRRPISGRQFATYIRGRQFDDFKTVAPGVVHGRYVEAEQRINVLLIHRSGGGRVAVSPAARGKAKVGEWASEVGAVAAVNGNWFDPFDGPAVSNGAVYGGNDHGYTALFGFTAEGDLVTDHHRSNYSTVDSRVLEGVSGHPTLILDRRVTIDFGGDPTFTSRQPRTAIGATGSIDVVILATVDGRSSTAAGMTGLETARLMERLDAHHAVMLDGGGSSAMWILGEGLANSPADPGRAVGNQLAVFSERN